MPNKRHIFTGAGTAIVTPFGSSGIDFGALGRLIDFQIAGGADAIIICGTTGEASTLTDAEHRAAIEFAVERVGGRIPVIAGTGSNHTDYALELSLFSKEAGADAVLLSTPYYNKCTQGGLIRHFFAVADAVELPMIVYNVPSRTGMTIAPHTYKELSAHPNIVATKEASGVMADVARTRELCGEALDIYSGNDGDILPVLSLGGLGVISVLSNLLPKQTHDMCALFLEGRVKESAELQIKYTPLIDALFCEVSPIPVKEALALMGMCSAEVRLPLTPMEEKNKELLVQEMRKTGLI